MEITGVGNGIGAGVTDENMLRVLAVIDTREHHTNHSEGQAYSISMSITPTGAGDCFFYMKNNSELSLTVSEWMFWSATDERFNFKLNDSGTPIGGTALTPGNRNAGSGNIADVTALYGVDITGMAGGYVVGGLFHATGTSSAYTAPLSGIIIPKNKILTAYASTGGIAITLGMGINFHGLGS